MHILLIEDDLDLGRLLHGSIKEQGYSSEWLRRAIDAPHNLDLASVDCVILDLSLPDGSGLELLKRWRAQESVVPIIIITAHSGLDERLAGFDSGADDFLVKPFALAELHARIRVALRRHARQVNDVWQCGPLTIDPRSRNIIQNGEHIELTRREFDLLVELARNFESVVDKCVLAQRLEPLGEPLDLASIDVHVSNLRKKLGAQTIRTVRGVGYMLVP